jgi:apolipoprotein N-acyltransferase
MQCNIDRRGQRIRYMIGIIVLFAGIVLVAATLLAAWPRWLSIIAALMMLGGAFGIFEARKKWCAVRAMGFRTPI